MNDEDEVKTEPESKVRKFLKQQISDFNERVENLNKIVPILEALEIAFRDTKIAIDPTLYSVTINVESVADLRLARKALKAVFPEGYKDKLGGIYHLYGDRGYAIYNIEQDVSKIQFRIDLTHSIEGFPVKLGKNCGFVETNQTYKGFSYQCSGDKS